MAQQIAYYYCDACDSTWHTGWDDDYAIKDMRDYCAVCQVTPDRSEPSISTPIYVTRPRKEERPNK